MTKLFDRINAENAELRREIASLAWQRDNHLSRLLKEREEHDREIEQMQRYATHLPDCDLVSLGPGRVCSCGLDSLQPGLKP